MSVSTLKPLKPRARLQRLVTLDRLAAAAAWVFWLAAVVTAVQLLLALTRSGALLTAVPSSQPGSLVCLSTPPALLHQVGSGLTAPALAQGVHATWGTASLCTAHPTFGQALAFAIALLPVGLLTLGALYLVMRLARTAARDGVYTPQAARLVLILGWWLLAGGLAATAAQAFARVNLLSELVTGPVDWGQWPAAWSVSWPVFWFGLGLIIFARIMRVSAGMRADLEGTV
jgi:hypothetical protein